ncbi:histidine kinase [Paenibacillus sp. MMS20-IR301]|uniref:sensor histidine kinase n=1 Tax=Paenibacillus sp. MMS20-IR301 TaxID=2895946 RepID=UPI0028E3EB67|nr:histidine kinase [Paenibacillus sp. MMS20-IR301]WNS43171.1 histidine kinase [Paenibacillus sp. MMS20-IR301]
MSRQRLPFRRFHHKLFLLILLLTLAPILIVGTVNILVTSNLFTRQLEESSDMILSRTAAPFEQLYQEFETTERLFLHDEELVQALNSHEESVLRQIGVANRLQQFLTNIKYINGDFSVSFRLPEEHYLAHYGLPVKADPEFLQGLSLDPGALEQMYRLAGDESSGQFTWIVPVGSITRRELYGCMLISLPYSYIQDLLGAPLESGQRQYLLTDNSLEGDILMGFQGAEGDDKLRAALLRAAAEPGSGRSGSGYAEAGNYYSARQVGQNWTLLGIVPKKHVLLPLYQVYQWTAGVMGLLLLVSTLVSSRVARNFSRPIERLASLVVRKKSDGAHLNIPPLTRGDEIGILYDGMRGLLMEIREEQVLKREYHLRLLQYQINPHFLYNSLDTINWKALEHRDRELTGMIGHLTGFLRAGLDGPDVVTVEQELKHLNSYIGMQQIRYKEQFAITVDMEPGLLKQRIVKISLQPLVENAIMHGMSRQAGGNRIEIRGRRADEDSYSIEVYDNGMLLDLAKVQRLLNEREPDPASFGIRNVHERIRLYFGEAFGIQVNLLEAGKSFELRLPFTKYGNE